MAYTDTARRPKLPPAKTPGVCRFEWCGKPVLTATGGKSKRTQHDECAERWRRWNKQGEIRRAVFDRADGHKCVDCRKVFPESQLEADHIQGLEFGGDNDPSNYTPRCVPCHDKKTRKEKEARKSVPARGPAGLVRDVTAVPSPPRTGMWMQAAAKTWLAATVALMAGWGWLDRVPPAAPSEWVGDAQSAVPGAALWAVVPALVPVGIWWVLRWRRNRAVNAQIVFERLSRTIGEAAAGRRRRFKVKRWKGGMPADVTIRVGKDFNPYDEDARRKLIEEFASVVGVGVDGVDAVMGKAGKVRLSVRTALPPEATPTGPVPAGDDKWAGEVTEVIRPVIDEEVTVTVTGRDEKNRPVEVQVTYPKRAAARSAKAKMPLLQQMRDSYPIHGREWFITHDPPGFCYRLESHVDPLQKTVPLPDLTIPDLHAGIPMGLTETGEPWLMPLAGPAAHLFCAGLSGAGKGSVEWATVRALGPGIRDRWIRLWVIDPKQGAELGAIEPMCAGFAGNDDEALPLLERLADVVDGKYERLRVTGARRLDVFTPDEPFDLLLIDEAASLYGGSNKKRNDAMMAVTKRLVNISRAAGVAIHVYTQNPLVESFPARDLFPRRFALRLGSADHVDRVLGSGAKDGGALVWRIPEETPGVGYLVVNGNVATPLRVRATYVDDREIARIVKAFTPGRPAPEHGRPVEPVAQPTLPDPEPDPEPDQEPGPGWVSLDDLADMDLPVSGVRLDSADPDLVVITSIRDDPEDSGRWLVAFRYDGEHSARDHSFDKGDCVMRVTR